MALSNYQIGYDRGYQAGKTAAESALRPAIDEAIAAIKSEEAEHRESCGDMDCIEHLTAARLTLRRVSGQVRKPGRLIVTQTGLVGL
jgi:hypothetical protein